MFRKLLRWWQSKDFIALLDDNLHTRYIRKDTIISVNLTEGNSLYITLIRGETVGLANAEKIHDVLERLGGVE